MCVLLLLFIILMCDCCCSPAGGEGEQLDGDVITRQSSTNDGGILWAAHRVWCVCVCVCSSFHVCIKQKLDYASTILI